MIQDQTKVPKPILDLQQSEEINQILNRTMQTKEELDIWHYKDEFILYKIIMLLYIRTEYLLIYFNNFSVPVNNTKSKYKKIWRNNYEWAFTTTSPFWKYISKSFYGASLKSTFISCSNCTCEKHNKISGRR
ncbi:YolD-like family protein [Bacillus sp. NPDC094106]|uniref:YolD-like family protein n=1 Tax=Bacillus sp. NPDC094106 TaxID=3363949 RepID=UPI003805B11A